MVGNYVAGFGSTVLVMLPAIILVILSMRVRDGSERGKRIISFVVLSLTLMTTMGFLGFLYVRPTYLNLNMLKSLPFLSRFIFNPWIFHTFIIAGLLIIGILYRGFGRALRKEHGFSVITILALVVAICMWVLGSIFHYGLAGRLLVGGGLSSRVFIPCYILAIFAVYYFALAGLYGRYLRKRRILWSLSIILLLIGLASFYFFAWYLPTFPLEA